MTSTILNTSVDCADPLGLAEFWSQVLDRPVTVEGPPGEQEVLIALREDHDLIFQQVPEPKTIKNRLHLCLQPDIDRDAEAARLLALGASFLDDQRRPDGTGWVVLADPEGNEFCVLRSAAERAATSG